MNRIPNMMMKHFGLSHNAAMSLIYSAPERYKTFKIPKRQEGEFRRIAQPAKEIKIIQRWLISKVINELPIHQCATAYQAGKGIKYNALQHVRNNYLLKMDFADYFPSITKPALSAHLKKYMPNQFDENDIEHICQIAMWRPKSKLTLELCIGGPSSPFISNTITYDFDAKVEKICEFWGVKYTRYADDLTFSCNKPDILHEIEHNIYFECGRLSYPKLQINPAKTVHTSKKHRRFVTGLTLSSEGKVSLGRERKRLISSMIHKVSIDRSDQIDMRHLKGLIAFALDVEPTYVENMRKKYGSQIIDKILSIRCLRKKS